jgi:hypothetical protein
MGLAVAAGLNFYAEEYTIGSADMQVLWKDGQSQKLIEQGGWDYVVLQPYWSSYDDTHTIMADEQNYTGLFDALIKQKNPGARTVIYATWTGSWGATSDNQYDYNKEEVGDIGKMLIAAQVGALPVKVGDAWQALYSRYPFDNKSSSQVPLYGPDGNHPTNTGHYYVANVIYVALTGVDPRGNTYRPPAASASQQDGGVVSDTNAAITQGMAWELK